MDARRLANLYQIVNDGTSEYDVPDLVYSTLNYTRDVVAYQGSTTGGSFDNAVCSPYQVSWHVDRACHRVSAASFDAMCADMIALGFGDDATPHASRVLVSDAYASSRVYSPATGAEL